jgi:hypothetical protein
VREWFIPADNSKNGKPHTIYLSDFALRHFAALQAINGGSKWCFPNRDDSEHVCVKTVTKQLGNRQRGNATPMSRRSPHTNALALPGGKCTPHDLRRTGATLMTALGVLPEVAEKCLNHTEESHVKHTYAYWHEIAPWGRNLLLVMWPSANSPMVPRLSRALRTTYICRGVRGITVQFGVEYTINSAKAPQGTQSEVRISQFLPSAWLHYPAIDLAPLGHAITHNSMLNPEAVAYAQRPRQNL